MTGSNIRYPKFQLQLHLHLQPQAAPVVTHNPRHLRSTFGSNMSVEDNDMATEWLVHVAT